MGRGLYHGAIIYVSKVILRHANLSSTQGYLGEVSDVEAVRWIRKFIGLMAGNQGGSRKASHILNVLIFLGYERFFSR